MARTRSRRPARSKRPAPAGTASLAERLVWFLVAIGMLAIPVVINTTGADVFRLPKQLLLIGVAIAIATISVVARLIGARFAADTQWSRDCVILLVASLFWSGLTTLTSSQRSLSINTLLFCAACTMWFAACWIVLQRRTLSVFYLVAIPAVITAVLGLVQRFAHWNPMPFAVATEGRTATIALLGNANDVGMFLVAPAMLAAAIVTTSRRHRVAAGVALAVILAGVAASETLGAALALGTGLFAMAIPLRPRLAVIVSFVGVVALFGVIRLSPVRWETMKAKFSGSPTASLDRLLSGRLAAFIAAGRMFRTHPLLGVGVGAFPYNYFDAKIAVEMDHPELMDAHPENFGEVHNEHLQILAETGLPGYAMFLAALTMLARVSRRPPPDEEGTTAAVAWRLAMPLAVAIAVLALSAFPFRLAAPIQNILFVSALTLAWSERASD